MVVNLNKDSKSLLLNNTMNFTSVQGGNTNTISSNQTYTNISEIRLQVIQNAKKIFKTS